MIKKHSVLKQFSIITDNRGLSEKFSGDIGTKKGGGKGAINTSFSTLT
jgi:hypothetical protein